MAPASKPTWLKLHDRKHASNRTRREAIQQILAVAQPVLILVGAAIADLSGDTLRRLSLAKLTGLAVKIAQALIRK